MGAYYAYALKQAWSLEESETSERKLSFIAPPAALKFFTGEVGQHCVQRVPPTERGGRRHTSLVSVLVTPLRKIRPNDNVLKDVEQIFQKFGGNGGQGVNKVTSGVRLTCLRTKISVTISGRSQLHNLTRAKQVMTERILEHDKNIQQRLVKEAREAQYQGGGRGHKKRTYNLIEDRVTDHISGNKAQCARLLLKTGCFERLQ
jgi:peptide chain release factor 1